MEEQSPHPNLEAAIRQAHFSSLANDSSLPNPPSSYFYCPPHSRNLLPRFQTTHSHLLNYFRFTSIHPSLQAISEAQNPFRLNSSTMGL